MRLPRIHWNRAEGAQRTGPSMCADLRHFCRVSLTTPATAVEDEENTAVPTTFWPTLDQADNRPMMVDAALLCCGQLTAWQDMMADDEDDESVSGEEDGFSAARFKSRFDNLKHLDQLQPTEVDFPVLHLEH